YPNPFNPSTNIRIEIPKASHVNLSVYNVLGQHITTLINKTLNQGVYNNMFNASNLPSGIYIYKLSIEGQAALTGKMMLIK
ncbi:MAG: T9SS type A sorting domain-containing protein, partial [Ignavibacteriaceae bacterium]|nr:T9SS type A sorting domain-containing protein [Ignavibacteriaceae bacterium]